MIKKQFVQQFNNVNHELLSNYCKIIRWSLKLFFRVNSWRYHNARTDSFLGIVWSDWNCAINKNKNLEILNSLDILDSINILDSLDILDSPDIPSYWLTEQSAFVLQSVYWGVAVWFDSTKHSSHFWAWSQPQYCYCLWLLGKVQSFNPVIIQYCYLVFFHWSLTNPLN